MSCRCQWAYQGCLLAMLNQELSLFYGQLLIRPSSFFGINLFHGTFVMFLLLKLYLLLCEGKPQGVVLNLGLFYQHVRHVDLQTIARVPLTRDCLSIYLSIYLSDLCICLFFYPLCLSILSIFLSCLSFYLTYFPILSIFLSYLSFYPVYLSILSI